MTLAIFPVDAAEPPKLQHITESRFQIDRWRLTQGKQAGCELIVVASPNATVAICPTRGMSLWRAKLDGVDCQWGSPVRGPIHPNWVPIHDPSGLGWLDGFDELLVRCGLRSFGAPEFDVNGKLLHPLHGSIGNLPAENVRLSLSDDEKRLTISGEVTETRFLLYNLKLQVEYELKLDEPAITIRDRVINMGGSTSSAQLLYHINFGKPLLDSGSSFHVAADHAVARDQRAVEGLETWNQYLEPTSGYQEQVYFLRPIADANGWVTTILAHQSSSRAVSVVFRNETLPYFTLWKNTASEATGYVTGLEPGTGFPNPRSFEESKGRLVMLEPGESRDFEIKIEATSQSSRLNQWLQALKLLQDDGATKLCGYREDWCTPRS